MRHVDDWVLGPVRVHNPDVTTPLRGGGVMFGSAVEARAEGLGLAVELTIQAADGRLAATAVAVRSIDGREVTSARLRQVPILHLIRSACTAEATRWSRRPSQEERMRQVAKVWRRHHADPATTRRATIETAHELRLTRGYVTTLLTAARRAGLLGGPTP